MKATLRILLVLLAFGLILPADASKWPSWLGQRTDRTPAIKEVTYAGTRFVLSYNPQDFRFADADIRDWIARSARTVAMYLGRFPVKQVNIALEATDGAGVMEGTAWATPEAHIRIAIGRSTTARELKSDGTMVHEMMHLGFPDLDETHVWLHEGVATYVEAVARAHSDELTPAEVWAQFLDDLRRGLPRRGDGGLDDTSSHDRRYWGGAMFCLLADIQIRQRTANRFGLKDALRGIFAAGGTLDEFWPVERALAAGDRAVGVPVLQELYATWKDKAVATDLGVLWRQLGVGIVGDRVRFDETAPLAAIRRTITAASNQPLLLTEPKLLHEKPMLLAGPKLLHERNQ